MSFDLGYLEYQKDEGLPLVLIIVIAVIVVVLFIILVITIIVVIARMQRSKRIARREYKRLLKLLAVMEASVRDQCRQGSSCSALLYKRLKLHWFEFLWICCTRAVKRQ